MKFMFGIMMFVSCVIAVGMSGCRKGSSSGALRPLTNKSDMDPNYVVALVNGVPLTWSAMEKRANGYLKDDMEVNHLIVPSNRMDEAKDHFRQRAIRAFAYKTIMLEEANNKKITVTEADKRESLRAMAVTLKGRNWTTNDFFKKGPMDEKTMREEFEDGVVIDKLLKLYVKDKLKIDDGELNELAKGIEATNELVRVKLEDVRSQILQGADFADVARKMSQDSSAKEGGDLGEFKRGNMMKEFEKQAFSQELGEVGPVFRTSRGYHIMKVTARTPAIPATDSTPAVPETVRISHIILKSVPLDRKKMIDSVLRTKYNKGVKAFYDELKAKASIESFLFKDMEF